MFGNVRPLVLLLVLAGAALVVFLFRAQFNAAARDRRRRQRNYRPPISKHKGPTIKLAANVPKSDAPKS